MNPLRLWNKFWFGPISARPLGVFRIVFGLVMLANLAFMAFDLDYWYTNAGLLQGHEPTELAGPYRTSLLLWIQDPIWVRLFFAATAIVACIYTVGWHTRIAGVFLYLMTLSIHHRNLLTNSGADSLVLVTTFYMMLAPSGAAFSLDAIRARRKRGTLAEPLIIPWAQRLIQFQISLIYFTTAMFKCNGSSWLNGTALHYVLLNTEVGRPFLAWLTAYPVTLNLMTFAVLFVEFALAFLLWFRPTRPWAILSGVGLHVGILFSVNIPIFGEMMTACYLTFLSADEVNTMLRVLNPKNWFAARAEVPYQQQISDRVDSSSRMPVPHWHELAEEEELVASRSDSW